MGTQAIVQEKYSRPESWEWANCIRGKANFWIFLTEQTEVV
ncbi:hypothetical protein F892_00529 [Acinetobacter vivianii]|uniref:Uncharacterized protein n=1 Tax=Acinetobacter vivianii TaxID=1776742 RepID=N9NRV8_9GAMM|nr:hypothetical protein F892_00529 [Acinetobacter vivianii]